ASASVWAATLLVCFHTVARVAGRRRTTRRRAQPRHVSRLRAWHDADAQRTSRLGTRWPVTTRPACAVPGPAANPRRRAGHVGASSRLHAVLASVALGHGSAHGAVCLHTDTGVALPDSPVVESEVPAEGDEVA